MEEMAANESSEGKLAEKLRIQKVQEDADLELATDLLLGEGSTTEDGEGGMGDGEEGDGDGEEGDGDEDVSRIIRASLCQNDILYYG